MQFEAVACRLFLHYSYTLAQKASNYGIFCFYYKYSEISNCHLTEVVQRQGSVRNGTRRTGYSYYFTFTDSIGKPHKILYDKALFQREMEVLMERSKGI